MTPEEFERKMDEELAKTDKAWENLEKTRNRVMANIEARHKSFKEEMADLTNHFKEQGKRLDDILNEMKE